MPRWPVLLLALAAAAPRPHPLAAPGRPASEGRHVRGMTISCKGWGREWGTEAFDRELDELAALGVNWIAIHPYAWLREGGHLEWSEIDPEAPPEWLARPLRETRARGMHLLVKPHVGYWGSGFSWRGEIDYPDPEEREHFFSDYARFVEELARATRGAAAFAVGTELEQLVEPRDEALWREIIASVRAATDARLTYAANWDGFAEVPFWDALDAIGVQAYFPLAHDEEPDASAIRRGWRSVLDELERVHRATGKPVVLTELGYDRSPLAAREPWNGRAGRGLTGEPGERAADLQARLLRVGLEVLDAERDWLRGAFLWKWFPGGNPRANFVLDTPGLRAEIARAWLSPGRR